MSLGCDGRDRVNKSSEEILIENKLLDSFSENVKYFPETYTEVETDTILSNGFRVKIKTFTDMENNYLDEFRQDTIIHKHFYRDNKATILVTKQGVIFDQLIDKDFLLQFEPTLSSFFEQSVLSGIWLNEEKSFANSNITVNILYCKPETDWCSFFNLIIEDDSSYVLKDVSEEMGVL